MAEDETKDAEYSNAPIRVDDDPYVGVNWEYRNSADDLGKPITSGEESEKKAVEAAIEDEKDLTRTTVAYGVADYEADDKGEKIEVERMGDKPEEKKEEAKSETTESSTPAAAPASAPSAPTAPAAPKSTE